MAEKLGKLTVKVPLHITGFFTPYYAENELETGSRGAGLVLTPGVEVSLLPSGDQHRILLNGQEADIEPLRKILSKLPPAIVSIKCPYPLGAGFGTSAAITTGAAILAAKITKWSMLRAFQEAHVAEVQARTGLGDVLSLYAGEGLVFRHKPGAPGVGAASTIKVEDNLSVIAFNIGRLNTADMLRIYADKIKLFGEKAVISFEREPSLENFLQLSKWFAAKVGFLDEKTRNMIKKLKNNIIGASVKKRVVFIVCEKSEVDNVVEALITSKIEAPYLLKINRTNWIGKETSRDKPPLELKPITTNMTKPSNSK